MYDVLNIPVNAVPQKDFPMAIQQLEILKHALHSKDDRKCARVGLMKAMLPPGTEWNVVIDNNLDQCCWQLSQFKKYSKPSRLREAVSDLEFVVARADRVKTGPGGRDMIPRYTLACALALSPGREADAARMFDDIMPKLTAEEESQMSALWARAEWTRLLRRAGEVRKAEEQEQWLRDWYYGHPYCMLPSKFKEAVLADGETTNVIMDGIKNFGKGVIELPDGKGMIMNGAFVMHV